ncbi:ABC-F family ATP-binding cassette domain-containing protein [Convivina praedatoris]|uniref:ABC-F family ATP-binding cassette domain-containing protein n=1 Tax=Convivina praedatoris TaxID=2880963 RepID=UPI00200FE4C0|nr:ABC-F family ATP-binding cassette domain-containing protein [Convivina sp. LMG 32447]CAH1853911.1 Energy-dependent translational throttle protein EttA [Convivina sp. LMG 32447]
MKQFRVENLTSTYGEKTLFDHISFLISEGDRIGLVGVNGSGKTSLLNALAGNQPADQGQIVVQNDYNIGYLRQDPSLDGEQLVMDAVFAGNQPVFKTIRYYQQALEEFSQNPEDQQLGQKFERAQSAMDRDDAWTAESQIKTILTQLHMPDLNRKIKELSGGQRKRVGLAQILIEEPDLLILDEPTNHLDFDSIAWLEKYLANYRGAVLTVTHDRYFLDAVANRIFELSFGKLYEYQGNYQDYVTGKAERVQAGQVSQHKKEQLYQRELAWMKKSARARTTKQKGREKAFAKLEAGMDGLQVDEDVTLSLGQQRLGKKVLIMENANLAFGDHQILKDFNLRLGAGERIGITGANGAGKSTFLNVIAGRIPLTSGIIELGETVKMAYYTQTTEPISEDKRVIEYLTDVASSVTDKAGNQISVSELLEQFLFPPFMHGTLIRKLSGGEKRRLYLLKLLLEQPNVLLLDEPTNDLDIGTLTILEDFLADFSGTVITVSHDRYFLDKVVRQLYIFTGNGIIERYDGLFSQYLEKNGSTINQPTAQNNQSGSIKGKKTKKQVVQKLTYKEKKEWATIENDIAQLEENVATLTEQMAQEGSNYTKVIEIESQLNQVNQTLEEKMDRWAYLSEIVEKHS